VCVPGGEEFGRTRGGGVLDIAGRGFVVRLKVAGFIYAHDVSIINGEELRRKGLKGGV